MEERNMGDTEKGLDKAQGEARTVLWDSGEHTEVVGVMTKIHMPAGAGGECKIVWGY